ncbi:MAG: tRNA lysidine(34) synthetase TilS [Anaerolineaceae bacterium]|nr:tRNA lysidine(34) synthetase TilS [Anaerolineaceae bacterium]
MLAVGGGATYNARMAVTRHKTVQAVAGTIRRHGLIDDGERVVVATSGGPDSVALASILNELSGPGRGGGRKRRFDIVLAHLNHGLRRTAARDERFVRGLAGNWGLPLFVERARVREMAKQRGVGIEEAAREARYAFLERTAEQAGAQRVALGHHGDDQAETVLMNFLRGGSVRGLAGMPIRRPISRGSSVIIIRPLLEVTRSQIMAYARARRLEWTEDETNRSRRMLRNRLRLDLLPLLERDYAHGLSKRLVQMAGRMASVEAFLSARAAAAWDGAVVSATSRGVEFDLDALRNEGAAVVGELILAALEHLGAGRGAITAEHLEAIQQTVLSSRGGQTHQLPGGVRVTRRGRRLRVGV